GAPNSSNSQRLREVAEREGCPIAVLAQRAGDLDWKRFEGIRSLGITAGASAPEVIVEEIMGAFAGRYELHVETVSAAEENEFFPLPRSLRPDAAEESRWRFTPTSPPRSLRNSWAITTSAGCCP